MTIKGYRVGPLLRKTGREILDDNILGLAAQTAYYFFFSLFPLLLFLAPLLAIVGDERETVGWLLGWLAGAVPPQAYELVRGVVEDVVFTRGAPEIASMGALLALWSGSNIFGALEAALNRAYDVEETRPWVRRQLLRVASLLVTGIGVVLATAVFLAGEDIARGAGSWLGLGDEAVALWTVVQFPLAVVVLAMLAWGVYYFLPNVRQTSGHALVAAVIATALWLVVTLAFRLYVQNFGSYNKTYGTIGGVIVLLTWMYLSMVVLLSAGELAAELHGGTGLVEGERGRLYGGRIGTGSPPRPSTGAERRAPMAAGGREQ
jgi:membrane protein